MLFYSCKNGLQYVRYAYFYGKTGLGSCDEKEPVAMNNEQFIAINMLLSHCKVCLIFF